ncbi:MAG: hypothetical protein FJX39_05770 [Alphaproteobacteria bacterium]|nr:hypothetical protein [Alphaproteobacteria bacterium]
MNENLNKLIYFFSYISVYLGLTYSAFPAENKIFVQENISAASFTKEGGDNFIRLQFLATDIEEIFQKTMKERIGVDLMRSGALENQIGEMVLKRIILSNKEGQACEKSLIKLGEDPSNDELVLIEIKFQCASDNFVYDPRALLSTHSHRSWQIILVHEGNAAKEYFVNSESAPVIITRAN